MALRHAGNAVVLRPVTAEDEAFLYEVYASTRQPELSGLGWTGEEKSAFLRQQFSAQDQHYRENYTGTTYEVIELDGRPAGRLYVARWEDEIRIMDIALLPEFRCGGIGTVLLSRLLTEGDSDGKRVSAHVEKWNPARRLYDRLGFHEIADRGVYVLMERRGSGGRASGHQAKTAS